MRSWQGGLVNRIFLGRIVVLSFAAALGGNSGHGMSMQRRFEPNLIGSRAGLSMCKSIRWLRRDLVTLGPRNYFLNTSRRCMQVLHPI